MSRFILHKVETRLPVGNNEEDDMAGPLLVEDVSEANEIVHTREDEELSFVRRVIQAIEELEEGEALVIRTIVI